MHKKIKKINLLKPFKLLKQFKKTKKQKDLKRSYRKILFLEPTDPGKAGIQIIVKDNTVSLLEVYEEITKDIQEHDAVDVRRSFTSSFYSAYAVVKTQKRYINKKYDSIVPLFYALPLAFSKSGWEVFFIKYQQVIYLVITYNKELVYSRQLSVTIDFSSEESTNYLQEEITNALKDIAIFGVHAIPERVVFLMSFDDNTKIATSFTEKFPNFVLQSYNIKTLAYKDVLNLAKPYCRKFLGSGFVHNIINLLLYFVSGNAHLDKSFKKLVSTIMTILILLSYVFFIGSVLTVANTVIINRTEQVQADLLSITSKKSQIEKYIKKYQNLLEMGQTYKNLNIEDKDFESIMNVVYNPNVSGLSLNENVLTISIAFDSPSGLDAYIDSLLKSDYFISISLPIRSAVKNTYNLICILR